MKFLLKVCLYLIIFGLLLSLIGAGVAVGVYHNYSQDLPKLDDLKDYNPPVVSEVFASDGSKIGEFWTEKRYILEAHEIPKAIEQAIVASEDDRFYEHIGIDFESILRALWANFKAGHKVQGGSTITQQVTKSLLLTREKTYTRKIKEAILAYRIEQNFTKSEILYLYLNQAFFGNRSYGVEAAAQNYYHKSARELNIAEAAMLAGLVKAPSKYSPFRDPKRAKIRQEYVIHRMYEVGSITKDQAQMAKDYPLQIYRASTDKQFNLKHTPWFTEHVRRYVMDKYGEQVPYTHGLKIYTTVDKKTQTAAENAVYRGLKELHQRQGYAGPIAQIPLDKIQAYSDENHLKIIKAVEQDQWNYFDLPSREQLLAKPTPLEKNKFYRAIVTQIDTKKGILEVEVGKVKGTIPSKEYGWVSKRNIHATKYQAPNYVRSPLSRFNVGDVLRVQLNDTGDKTTFSLEQEPIVEGALFSYEVGTGHVKAMVGGKSYRKSEFNRATQALRQTGSIFKPLLYAAGLDKGYTLDTVIDDAPIYYEYSPGRFWSPQNYGGGYKGPTTFRSALVNSRNVVTVKILMDIGIDFTTAFVRKLGITTPIKQYYSMALGANDMKLFEVTRAFGVFPNGGILPELVFVTKITDRYGRILEEHQAKEVIPFQDQAIANMNLSAEERIGTGYNEKLKAKNERWIDRDKLKLTDIEKRILYGNYIPKGYVISPRTAYTMIKIMNDIVNFGTGTRVKALGRPAAGKTGTTNDESDAWFVGYTPNMVAGVWVGFDTVKRLGSRETGGKTAAPIFLYYMKEALEGTEVAKFNIPQEINDTALQAPIDVTAGDPEAGGIQAPSSGAEFFIYDF